MQNRAGQFRSCLVPRPSQIKGVQYFGLIQILN